MKHIKPKVKPMRIWTTPITAMSVRDYRVAAKSKEEAEVIAEQMFMNHMPCSNDACEFRTNEAYLDKKGKDMPLLEVSDELRKEVAEILIERNQ